MTTASVLLTVGTTWSSVNEKPDKDSGVTRVRNLAEIADRELRETPAMREQTLRIMREWIQNNSDIRNVRQGDVLHFDIKNKMTNQQRQRVRS